ncbi:MAG: hypothetical protein HY046_13530 [Acidobacteria bacterium]|nr:hypothetical protein [Acidobacteriota bacterium]
MSEEQNVSNAPEYEPAHTARWIPAALVIVLGVGGYGIYNTSEARKALQTEVEKTNQRADLLSKQLDKANGELGDLKAQFDVTAKKLGMTQDELSRARTLAQNIRKEQEESGKQLQAQIGQLKTESEKKIGDVATDVKGAKGDIEATRKELEATKSKLERTVGDQGVMSGLIARNREDLEELKRRGERSIFEFDVKKSKVLQKVGPIQVQLKGVDLKKFKYTMQVLADDRSIEKKDKNVAEPVQFYVARNLYEMVVFEVQKDRVIGYLSAPKDLSARK